MPARLMEEALRAWREGERVLDVLPPTTPEHEAVRLAIIRLREAYQRVATLRGGAEADLATDRADIDEARAIIRRIGERAETTVKPPAEAS